MAKLAKIQSMGLDLLLKIKLGVLNHGWRLIEIGRLRASHDVWLVYNLLLVVSSRVLRLDRLILLTSHLLNMGVGLIVWPILGVILV